MIGLTSLLLIVYKFVVVEWCRPLRSPVQRLRQKLQLISTYKYEKSDKNKEEDTFNSECVVCLLTFEDGQDYIDMWLYSHPDCPICRSLVGPPVSSSISFIDEDIPSSGSPEHIRV
ncbi:hypothetical protein MKW94_021594 [Papaver nudicaule]|uniref:Uncharacterized protein n=1 Tax=Papaver nudicaule TaxID=74823 RepID=A0AA41W136_PAPNU|nr:hypothetical protein [Papaver nudicaule]